MKTLLRLAKRIFKQIIQVYYTVVGSKLECNICQYKTNTFGSDSWHLYCNCPNCGSSLRQRLLFASLTLIDNFSIIKIIKDKQILHFAPENYLSKLIKQNTAFYKTADFFAEGYFYNNIDYNLDISNMKEIKDESFDCVIACDVLEHVNNHIEGIKEVYRILNNGGYCIFTVPQKDNLKYTIEDFSITDPKQREKVFGQHDHLRIYGDDFTEILEKVGFKVTAINERFFEKKIVKRFVLFPPVLSKHPLATNYRKVFFGEKI